MDKTAVPTSVFKHSRTPSWLKWDHHFKSLLPLGDEKQQLLDFQEHDVKSHGVFGAMLKYGYKSAKHTAVYEWMQEFSFDKGSLAQTENQKNFFLTCESPALLALVEPLEEKLLAPHYNTTDGRNEKNVGPLVAAGAVLRHEDFTDENPPPVQNGVVDRKRENNLNNAPTLAFNKLLGQPFFRNKMEAIWFKSRSHSQHPALGITDFVADGGLRETAISHGNRIPYVAADLRIHPLAVVPVATLSLNKLLLMATNPRMFNLLVAATVRCTAAIIRFDRVLFMNEEMTILRPRIESNLITLKRHKTKAPVG